MNEQQRLLQLKNIFISLDIDYIEDELIEFASFFKEKRYNKGDTILEKNSTEKQFGYITSGLMRFFFTTLEGKEYNQNFKCEHQIFANYYTIFLNEPSPLEMQALEPTIALVADYDQIVHFYNKSRCWDKLGRKIIEINFIHKALREKDLLINDASTRLNNFRTFYAKLIHRISKHHLALYLGINPASLSRLLKQEKDNTPS
ncbi:MAG: Crp/Fnr family transcriptional regulator [Bacteriovoracaceae bacterium]|jgi:CRP-like cAMP-binding protein|nr:Crp/Fnr family transcriptional regulator [Bacteriovoracaceae bacterium]